MIFPSFVFFCLLAGLSPVSAAEQENPFPVLPGLENAVEFWKLVFTRYGANEVIFHDPQDPLKIHKVAQASEREDLGRLIKQETPGIAAAQGVEAGRLRIRAQRGVKERFVSGLVLSRRYLDQMQKIFREEDVPVDLTYLPLVESSFDITARSRVGALGMWQFMPATGKKFMRVGPLVDERRDPLESTRAAAKLLKQNYEVLGSWPLAITAYNHGREGMLRASAAAGSTDLAVIVKNYDSPTFGFASKNFYAEFLAAVEIAKKSEEHFPGLDFHPPLPLEEFTVERATTISTLLKRAGLSHAEFLAWNPALTAKVRDIPAGYRVKAPGEKIEALAAAYQKPAQPVAVAKAKPAAPAASALSWIFHRVVSGDTLWDIAKNYRVTVTAIQTANRLNNGHRLAIGQQLRIPKKA
ncbi:MAG: hypothetical protein A3F90_02775 [Deltaproteobacteria bacterium RIFCSPLOWO2_12_FULL_60_19]|nr:MAG: hypothetical protein A3F90_02775 [Deltaproteobacteria bacterium RIFCSPLOWO2_12_FULL_60_19]